VITDKTEIMRLICAKELTDGQL